MTDAENVAGSSRTTGVNVNINPQDQGGDNEAQVNTTISELQAEVDIMKSAMSRITGKLANLPKEAHGAVDKMKFELMNLATCESRGGLQTSTPQNDKNQASFNVNYKKGSSRAARVLSDGESDCTKAKPVTDTSESTAYDSGGDEHSEISVTRTKRRVPLKKYTKVKYEHANASSVDQQMIEALNRLDSRISPKPEAFDILSGQSMHKFFSDFESYCSSKFNCDEDGFVPELGRNLTGEAHNVYYAVRGPNDSYRDVKSKMLKWFEESKSLRKSNKFNVFKDAVMTDNESLYVYGARLEKLFRAAFPRKIVERSETLRQKYICSVPRIFRQQIETSVALAKVNGEVLEWSKIFRIAAIQDNNASMMEHHNGSFQTDASEVFNVNSCKIKSRVSDASVQTYEYPIKGQVYANTNRRVKHAEKGYNKDHKINRSAYESRDNTNRCTFCNATGHFYAKCRKRLKQCLRCGSSSHFMKDCHKGNDNENHVFNRNQNSLN